MKPVAWLAALWRPLLPAIALMLSLVGGAQAERIKDLA